MFDKPLLSLENWPVIVICVGMLAAAIIDWWKFKVPNKLTFPLILSGWGLGLANTFGLGAGDGGIGAALFGTFLGCALLIPVYAIGGMGAGDVKMTMGFGSWMGAFYGIETGSTVIFWAFCAGVLIGGVIGLGMILARGKFQQNAQHLREILGDMFKSSGISEIADKANNRRPRWHRLPYGVPLCIGFLGYLMYVHNFNF
ncbi:MAG: prepilin peptidase [Planctomycetes bacterium]|nr:prepilin peptidase [Planctomycetota bacterium]